MELAEFKREYAAIWSKAGLIPGTVIVYQFGDNPVNMGVSPQKFWSRTLHASVDRGDVIITPGFLASVPASIVPAILAHELGHLLLNHEGGRVFSQEVEADAVSAQLCGCAATGRALNWSRHNNEDSEECREDHERRLRALWQNRRTIRAHKIDLPGYP